MKAGHPETMPLDDVRSRRFPFLRPLAKRVLISEVVPVGWTSGPSKLIKTFAGRASGLVAVEDRSD
jgi:hypothetical protein